MEIEGDNTIATLEKIPKKAVVKKRIDELSANLYGVETGLSDSKGFTQFYSDLKSATTLEEQIRLIVVLNKTSPDLINKFTNFKGMELISDLLAKASLQPSEKAELLEKILAFLNKITLNSDILDRTQIHIRVENIKNCLDMPENLCSSAFRLLTKWKKTIEYWTNERKRSNENSGTISTDTKEEKRRSTLEQDYNRSFTQRNFIKRTNDRNRDRPRIIKEYGGDTRNSDKRRSRILDRYERRKEGSSSRRLHSRTSSRYDRNNSGYRRHRTSSSRSPSNEERSPKKNVRFNDEPTAPGLAEDEVRKIRQRIMELEANNDSFHNSEEYKHKESLLEAQSIKQKKDSEKEIQENLSKMQEKIKWSLPTKIKVDPDNLYAKNLGKESIEAEQQQKRIAAKLSCLYLKDYQIPNQPSYERIMNSSNNLNEPMMIPLHSTNEIQEMVSLIEQKIKHGEQKYEKKEDQIQAEEIKAEQKEIKQVEKKSLKGILKKSKEELNRIRQEEKRKLELKKRAEESKKTEEMIANVIQEEVPTELRQEILTALKNSKNSNNIVENIKILLETKKMQQQQSNSQNSDINTHLYDNRFQQDGLYGDQLHKKVKTSSEAYNPLYQSGPPPQQQSFPNIPSNLAFMNQNHQMQQNSQYQSINIIQEGHNNFSSNDTGKRPFKPQNYKTIPCRLFHSPQGCQYGDNCHYIHDLNYAGRETPNMHKYVRPLNSLNNDPQANTAHTQKDSRVELNQIKFENEKKVLPNYNQIPYNNISTTFQSNEGSGFNKSNPPIPRPNNQNPNFPPQQQQPIFQNTQNLSFHSQQLHHLQNSHGFPQNSHQQQHLQAHKSFTSESRPNYQQQPLVNNGPIITQKPNYYPYNQPRDQQQFQLNHYNQAHQAQQPLFSQPIQPFVGSGGLLPQQIQFSSNKQFTPNNPSSLTQQHGPSPFQQNQQSLNIPNRGPPLPQSSQTFGPSETRGFNNPLNSEYPPRIQQVPGSNSHHPQFKPPNSMSGPTGSSFYKTGYKNNIKQKK